MLSWTFQAQVNTQLNLPYKNGVSSLFHMKNYNKSNQSDLALLILVT